MTVPTSSWASEWDAIMPASRGVSHRSTTSSRRPGKAIEGTVHYEVRQVVPCPACGSMRLDLGGPHAPRYGKEGRVVDCVGRVVEGWR